MALANDNKRWPGNQSDAPFSNDEHTLKPIAQPPCDLSSQKQFEDITEYLTVKRDRWGNEVPVDWANHLDATPGTGAAGSRQFSDFQQEDGYSGYGVEIPHGTSAAFNKAETMYVAVDRADRGKSE